MTILVIGAHGHLARALVQEGGKRGATVVAQGRPKCDLTRLESLRETLSVYKPHTVINAGAYTAVDDAESSSLDAFAVNAKGAEAAARACEEIGARFIHVSTDYVFDGAKGSPYQEHDKTNPLNAYGASKRDGEKLVLSVSKISLVLRTSWIFAATGKNFFTTMMGLASRDEIRVVTDQISCPTYVNHFAEALLRITAQPRANWTSGIYHLAGDGGCSRFEFVRELFRQLALKRQRVPNVQPTTSAEFPLPATRPNDSRLDSSAIEVSANIKLPSWKAGVEACINELDAVPNID